MFILYSGEFSARAKYGQLFNFSPWWTGLTQQLYIDFFKFSNFKNMKISALLKFTIISFSADHKTMYLFGSKLVKLKIYKKFNLNGF